MGAAVSLRRAALGVGNHSAAPDPRVW